MLTPPLGALLGRFRALGIVLVTLLSLVLAACADPPSAEARRFGPGGVGDGQSQAPPSDTPVPSTSSSWTSTPTSPSTMASRKSSTPPVAPGEYADRIPTFDPPPRPHRARRPEGAGTPWMSRIPTDQPVAFITIDDGWVKRPEAHDLLRRAKVPVTLFLTINAIRDDPAYFKRLQEAGAVIESHTITHAKLAGKSYAFQRQEICDSAEQLGAMYGRRPSLFRPPFGEKDATTLKAAHDCGMKAALFWKQTVDKGVVRFQTGNTVQAGDILLLHFRDRFVDDFIASLQAIKAAGLTPALLEDYV